MSLRGETYECIDSDGASGSLLSLSSVSPEQAGAYQVKISGPGGEVASDIATLSILRPVLPFAIRADSLKLLDQGGLKGLVLSIESISGRTYQVEIKQELGRGSWAPLGPRQTATDDSLVFSLNLSPFPQAFLRVV